MIGAAHPASQYRSLLLPAAHRSTRALTSARPMIRFDSHADAEPAHALDQRGWCSWVRSTKLRVTALRSDARDLPPIHKSP
jgi:hypothetical protein